MEVKDLTSVAEANSWAKTKKSTWEPPFCPGTKVTVEFCSYLFSVHFFWSLDTNTQILAGLLMRLGSSQAHAVSWPNIQMGAWGSCWMHSRGHTGVRKGERGVPAAGRHRAHQSTCLLFAWSFFSHLGMFLPNWRSLSLPFQCAGIVFIHLSVVLPH